MLKKTMICVLILALAFCSAAMAQPNDSLFEDAKKAMALISYEEYGQAKELLGLDDVSEEDFASAMRSDFRVLFRGTVQTDVAVMFREADGWYLAIPVAVPGDDMTETMLFSMEDGAGFTGVSSSIWGDVSARVDGSLEYVWNEEYRPAQVILEPDI